jgi:tetratricopeptide (TPR) repeat protein
MRGRSKTAPRRVFARPLSGQARQRRRSTWFTATVVSVALLFLVGLWWCRRPDVQRRRGLEALTARHWERLHYVEAALPQTSDYIAPQSLFAGALKLERREFSSALRDLRFAANDRRLQPLAWLLAGEALYAQNRFREAELNFQHAVELDPNLADAHRWMAIGYYDVGLLNQALVHLRRVAELDASDPRPHRLMALIHLDRGGYAIAIEDLQESLRRDANQPDREDMLAELASCQLELNRYEDAQRTLEFCPKTGEVLAMRAEAEYALGDREQARRLAQQALDSEMEVPLALSVLGKLALDERRYADAIEMLTHGADIAPSNYHMQYNLVTALRAAGRHEAAEKQLAAAEAIREVRDQFEVLLEQAAVEPYNPDIRYQLGLLSDRLGQPQISRMWMKAAVILDPHYLPALAELKKHGSTEINAADILGAN